MIMVDWTRFGTRSRGWPGYHEMPLTEIVRGGVAIDGYMCQTVVNSYNTQINVLWYDKIGLNQNRYSVNPRKYFKGFAVCNFGVVEVKSGNPFTPIVIVGLSRFPWSNPENMVKIDRYQTIITVKQWTLKLVTLLCKLFWENTICCPFSALRGGILVDICTKDPSSYIVNTIDIDGMATQGGRASAASGWTILPDLTQHCDFAWFRGKRCSCGVF